MSREWVRSRAKAPARAGAAQPEDEAVRKLAARLAHQLGNLLQVINGNLELIAQRTTDETTLRYIANARTAADQLTELTRSLPVDSPD
jgi:signal transduction histidine kinase